MHLAEKILRPQPLTFGGDYPPYVEVAARSQLLREVWPKLKEHQNGIGDMTKAASVELVNEIQQQHWFVRWENIDLLNMIEKKELSAVYA